MPACRIALLTVLGVTVSAQQDDPILARLPANTTSVFVLRDPMPHVDALLGAEPVRALLAASGDLQQELLGMRLDAAALQRQIGLFRNLVPVEVGIAGSQRTTAAVLAALEAGLALGVLPLLADQQDTGELVAELRAAAAASLPGLAATELLAWVRTRDERTAEQWYDALAEAAAELPAGDGLVVEERGEGLTIRMRLLTAFGGRLRQRLVQVGIEVPADLDPELVATVEQSGDRLQLRLGQPPAGPLAAAQLGPLWSSRPQPLVFAKVDLGDLQEEFDEVVEGMLAAADTVDDEATAARLFAAVARFEQLAVSQCGSVVVDDGVAMTVEQDVGEFAPDELDAPDAAVLRCLERGHGPFTLSASSLDVWLVGWFAELATRTAQRGRLMGAGFAAAYDYLGGEESAVFAPGTLVVTRPAACRSVAEPPLGAMPFAALAVVARAHSAAEARDFVHAMTGHLLPDLGDDDDVWPEQDLGLGVPTNVLDLAKVLPAVAAAGLDADFAPHWCTTGSLLIVSTDPKLTAGLLARARGEAVADVPVENVIDWSHWPGEHWGSVCAGLAVWWRALPKLRQSMPPALRRFDALLEVVAALAPSVDHIETVSELDGTTLRSVSRLRLRAPR